MRELRWLLRAASPIAALAAVAVLGSGSLRATGVATMAATTGCAGPRTLTAAILDAPPSPTTAAAVPAFAISPLLDGGGTLAGQRLELGAAGRTMSRFDLPPESFAAGPFGRAILVGSDDGRRSTLRAFDAATGCSWSLATTTDVIRRATIDPAAGNVYEFRVDRGSRADLGVWRRPLAGGPGVEVLAPLPADDRYGPTFSTELSWSTDGDVLVVQSCAMSMCRTRLLDTATAAVRTLDTPDQGEVIGLAAGRLITFGACRGVPCPVASIDTTTRKATTLTPAVRVARLVATGKGPRVLAEVGADEERAFVLVDPASAATSSVRADIHDWHLVPSEARAEGAVGALPGWVLLTRDGRAVNPGQVARLLRVDDGATLDLTEVTR